MTKLSCLLRGRNALILGAAAPLSFTAVPAFADQTTTTLSVSATVTARCSVSTSAVNFGSVNTLSGGNVDATGGVTVTCTNGTDWAAAANLGSGSGATLASRRMTSGSNSLAYSLYTDASRTSVWGDGTGSTATLAASGTGSAQTFTIYGRVPAGQSNVPPGSYTDVVAVTVTY